MQKGSYSLRKVVLKALRCTEGHHTMCTSARCATVSDKSRGTTNDRGLEATFQQSTAPGVIPEGLSMPRYEVQGTQQGAKPLSQKPVPVPSPLLRRLPSRLLKGTDTAPFFPDHCCYIRFWGLNPATVAGPPGSLQLRLHVVESCCRSQSWDELPAYVACSVSWSRAQMLTCALHSSHSR